jgi:hypothetical protein
MSSAATDTLPTKNWQLATNGLESNTKMGEAAMVLIQTTPERTRGLPRLCRVAVIVFE